MSHYDNGLARARQRRQRRSATIAGLVALIVFGGFGYSVSYFAGWIPGSRPPAPPASCTRTPPPPPQHRFQLNVYNASGDQGQAGHIGEVMESRGFDVGVIANDPYKEELDHVGQIRFGPAGHKFAEEYVTKVAPEAELVQDGRTGTSVDLVLGKTFPHLKKAPASPEPTVPGC